MCEQINAMLAFKLPKLVREAALTARQTLGVCSCTVGTPVCLEGSQFKWKLFNSRKLSFSVIARDREDFGNHTAFL